MSSKEKLCAKQMVAKLLEKGWIQPSSSPYSSPILFVSKKDGGLRMCMDCRAFNGQTVKDRYPLPRIDDLLDKLLGASVFSSLDMASGYHQITTAPEDLKAVMNSCTGISANWKCSSALAIYHVRSRHQHPWNTTMYFMFHCSRSITGKAIYQSLSLLLHCSQRDTRNLRLKESLITESRKITFKNFWSIGKMTLSQLGLLQKLLAMQKVSWRSIAMRRDLFFSWLNLLKRSKQRKLQASKFRGYKSFKE